MDYPTARSFLLNQTLPADRNPDALLARLQQGTPPIPGQITSTLLCLKVVFEALQAETHLDRELVFALHVLAWDSRHWFETKRRQTAGGWPPLLDEDLTRIAIAVKSIFAGTWQSPT